MENNENQVKRERQNSRKYFMGGLITGLLLAVVIVSGGYISSFIGKGKVKETSTQQESIVQDSVVDKMKLVEDSVQKYFLDEVDQDAMTEGIYKGMVENLGDPYSTYYSQEELAKVQDSINGTFYGIGAYIGVDEETGGGKLTKVMDNTPAMQAGLEDNDIIVEVDGESVLGMDLSDIIGKVKGKEHTEVELTIYRAEQPDYLYFTVKRAKIESETVLYEKMEDGIAYIQIVEFDKVTTQQFTDSLEEAKSSGMESLILDLRNNPGGNLQDVVEIAQQILPEGLVVYTEDKNGKRNEYFSDGKKELQVPIVVLVNGNSASASEILAGAIQDHNKGTILGTKTFGKGIVQKIFSITDGSALKLTISNYYTPNGTNIHGVGIEPDEVVELDIEKYFDEEVDNQLERAKEILAK